MIRITLSIIALLAPASAYANNWTAGCAPAPEIGAGVFGAVLSVAAVKWFRKRSR